MTAYCHSQKTREDITLLTNRRSRNGDKIHTDTHLGNTTTSGLGYKNYVLFNFFVLILHELVTE